MLSRFWRKRAVFLVSLLNSVCILYPVCSLQFVLIVWKTADPTCWLIDSWIMTHWLIWLIKHPFSSLQARTSSPTSLATATSTTGKWVVYKWYKRNLKHLSRFLKQRSRQKEFIVCYTTSDKVMYRSIPKPPMPPPPPGKPRAFDFFEKCWSNSPLCCQFRRSNAPPITALKRVKTPTLQAC